MVVSKAHKKQKQKYQAQAKYNRTAEALTTKQFKILIRKFYEFAKDKGFHETIKGTIENNGFYIFEFQREIADNILRSIFMQIDMDVNISIMRQVGKTEFVSVATAFCFENFYKAFKRPMNIAIIAPEKDTAGVVFNRVTKYIDSTRLIDGGDTKKYKESLQGDTIQLFGIYDEYKGSTIEGRDFDMVVRDEAHLGNDRKFIDEVEPTMLSKVGALVMIGNGGFKKCLFSNEIEKGSRVNHKTKHERILIRYTYEELKPYLQKLAAAGIKSCGVRVNKVESYIERHGGKSSLEVLKNIYCKWIFEYGNVITEEQLAVCRNPNIEWNPDKPSRLYAAIDFATLYDRSICTIMNEKKEIIDWIVMKEENEIKKLRAQCTYLRDQCDEKGYTQHIQLVGFDATGVGGGAVEFLEEEFESEIVLYTFSDKKKHEWYMNAIESMSTGFEIDRMSYNPNHEFAYLFEKEWLDIERKQLDTKKYMSFKAPERKGFYDDFCASYAICLDMILRDIHYYGGLKPARKRLDREEDETEDYSFFGKFTSWNS